MSPFRFWYGLAEAHFHIGSQAGHAPSRSIEPFERALALDSTFAPALIHPLEIAYLEGDSTRGRSWTNDYLALDSTSFYAQGFRLLTPLQFGPPEDSTFAAQALDTASTSLASLIQDRGGEDEALRIYGSLYQTTWLEALGYLCRAQLHERRGEREEALRSYARFAELWANADSHLQPQVQSARRAMERLAAERATS